MAKILCQRIESASLVNETVGGSLKILQVYYEPLLSGQTTHVLSLSKGLVLRGHDVTVILPVILQAISSEYIDNGVRIIALPMRKLLWPIKSIIAYLKILHNEKFDLVHVHSQEAGVTARCLSWVGGAKKIFYTPQTIDIRQSRWRSLYSFMERLLALITTRIFSVNQVDAKRLVTWGIPAEKVSVVPNGIDLSQFENHEDRDAVCTRLGLKTDHPVIMQLGRLSPQKDPDMFVKGARHVLTDVPDAQLVWIGEGPLLNEINKEVESLGLDENIHLFGRINHAYHCLVAADVVTSTSRWEGLPYSLLEAMACAKPVVSTAVNGCSEVVIDGETGYLVEVGDALGWAKSILRVIADPEQAKLMGAAGRCLVEEKYSLSMMITRIEQAYIDN